MVDVTVASFACEAFVVLPGEDFSDLARFFFLFVDFVFPSGKSGPDAVELVKRGPGYWCVHGKSGREIDLSR